MFGLNIPPGDKNEVGNKVSSQSNIIILLYFLSLLFGFQTFFEINLAK